MKEMKNLLTISVLLFLLCACRSSEQEVIRQTVIVYISGENSLSGNINNDLAELTSGSKSMQKDERLVAFVDNNSLPYIVAISDGERDTIKTFTEDFYASDPEKFYEIISWIEQKYPSAENNYGLVLWGHASGWIVSQDTVASTASARPRRAYGQDLGNNQSYGFGEKWMNITQMRRVLERLPKFRYILADCCCFLTAETAYELRNVTDYLIGSPAEIPAAGAPYHLITTALFSKSDDFYKSIVDTYYDYYTDYFNSSSDVAFSFPYLQGHSVPLAVVDMKEMEGLAQATRNLLMAPDEYKTDSVAYFYNYDMPSLYDLGGVMKRNLTADNFAAWKMALDKAVPYKKFSAKWMSIYKSIQTALMNDSFLFDEETYTGLSIHIPQARYNFNPSYNAGLKSFEWYEAVGWNRFE